MRSTLELAPLLAVDQLHYIGSLVVTFILSGGHLMPSGVQGCLFYISGFIEFLPPNIRGCDLGATAVLLNWLRLCVLTAGVLVICVSAPMLPMPTSFSVRSE